MPPVETVTARGHCGSTEVVGEGEGSTVTLAVADALDKLGNAMTVNGCTAKAAELHALADKIRS